MSDCQIDTTAVGKTLSKFTYLSEVLVPITTERPWSCRALPDFGSTCGKIIYQLYQGIFGNFPPFFYFPFVFLPPGVNFVGN
ncbi:MAG: hypothetical protein CM1200mP39_16660 [Dehalococcoidia bacterium]|nr:MAG: hypothetical protein CM1200mP39_16660 [Dehalococcoidia bacterium]